MGLSAVGRGWLRLAAAHFSDGGLKYCLDLITPPEWARTITSTDEPTSELNMKSFLHSAVEGGNVEIVAHLADPGLTFASDVAMSVL